MPEHITRSLDRNKHAMRVWLQQNGQCFYCRHRFLIPQLTRDHFIPRAMGGRNLWENIVLACRDCNLEKGRRLPTDREFALFKETFGRNPPGYKQIMQSLSPEVDTMG